MVYMNNVYYGMLKYDDLKDMIYNLGTDFHKNKTFYKIINILTFKQFF